jgi:hypothetical protein
VLLAAAALVAVVAGGVAALVTARFLAVPVQHPPHVATLPHAPRRNRGADLAAAAAVFR